MSRWFRHYAGMMRDDKLVRCALRAKQPVERVVWIWGAILESAAEINDGGRYDFDAAEAAYFLRADEADICAVVAELSAAGRLADGRVVKWGERQFESDRSAARQSAYRERQKSRGSNSDAVLTLGDGGVTPASRHGDAPETETETETETEKKKVIRAVGEPTRSTIEDFFEEFWKVYPQREGANPKSPAFKVFKTYVAAGADPKDIIEGARRCAQKERAKIGTEYIVQAVKWLREQRWKDYLAEEKPRAECEQSGFYASFSSEEMFAWSNHERLIGKTYPRDKNGGWRFPTQWPPGLDPPVEHREGVAA